MTSKKGMELFITTEEDVTNYQDNFSHYQLYKKNRDHIQYRCLISGACISCIGTKCHGGFQWKAILMNGRMIE